jgi:non-ribosomal peptide synthetase component F
MASTGEVLCGVYLERSALLNGSTLAVAPPEDLAALAGVKELLAGSDVLSVEHVNRAVRELPETRINNGYGELYTGGLGAARGYLRRPSPTAERYLRDPFATQPGARMYRTGDLARMRPDGNLEFLGRRDHRVKLRGSRIELEEVESPRAHHPRRG